MFEAWKLCHDCKIYNEYYKVDILETAGCWVVGLSENKTKPAI